MVLLRRVIGDALRARRQAQHRTLREVSTAANVSLGYLSEIERGHKEASSELLASICDALGALLSEVMREVSDTMELAEQMDGMFAAVPEARPSTVPEARPSAVAGRRSNAVAGARAGAALPSRDLARAESTVTDGQVSVSVRRDSPLKTTLRTTRTLASRPAPLRLDDRELDDREVEYAA